MPVVPSATTTIEDTAGVAVSGLDLLCLWAPCATNADMVPRQFGSAKQIYDEHGFCDGVGYAALHAAQVKKPILFVGLPISTPGAISRENKSGNTGTSVTTVTAGGDGVLGEHGGVLKVGGTAGATYTVGTDQIMLELSLDDGRTFKNVRLGTAASYTIPYFNVVVAFGAGTLKGGETIHTWHGSAPLSSSSDWATARGNLAAQLRGFRSILLCGDLASDTLASAYLAELDAYETSDERFVYGRCSVYDRQPLAAMSRDQVRMTGAPTLTFLEVGAGSDTITRSAGSWIADGFVVDDVIAVTGSASNNVTSAVVAGVTALVLTLGAAAGDDLVSEGPVAGCAVIGSPRLTFAEVGVGSDTITRSRGSFLTDGFRIGDVIAITGTASNNLTAGAVTGVTALALTLGAGAGDDLAAEVIASRLVTITAGQTKAAWMAEIDAEFSSIDDAMRIDLSAGRCRVICPFTGWYLRRPASWFASLREYQHDLHVPTWRKSDGPFNASLNDANGNLEEWDDRVDGGAGTAARFTTMRTWANGPAGPFICRSLTRASEGSLLGDTHNVAVANLACTTVQLNTEDAAIGVSLILNRDGTATSDSLASVKGQVDRALEQVLLTDTKNEGQRASQASWSPDADVLFNVADAEMLGVTELNLRGTVVRVNTKVRVISGGQ
jgi:hypothetical protein